RWWNPAVARAKITVTSVFTSSGLALVTFYRGKDERYALGIGNGSCAQDNWIERGNGSAIGCARRHYAGSHPQGLFNGRCGSARIARDFIDDSRRRVRVDNGRLWLGQIDDHE